MKNMKKTIFSKIPTKPFSSFKPSFFKDLPLKNQDPEIYNLLRQEEKRQFIGLELIASENYASKSVMQVLGSVLQNKYSEGEIGKRYYGGNEVIDQIETLCKTRTLNAFDLNKEEWDVNVQALSGSPANLSVYTAVLKPGEKLMGLHLYSGGHLTHGFRTADKKISASSYFFDSDFYYTNPETGIIDYDDMAKRVLDFKPKLLITGASAYSKDWDYKKFKSAADSVGALLMADISHVSGLVAAKEQNNPFEYCDIVTSTTHKSLRGPRSGLIFYNHKKNPGLKEKIDFAVFPMIHGGPHNHQIGAVATQMKEVLTPEFKQYAIQVKKNANELCNYLFSKGLKIVGNGTENHLFLWDVRPLGITGQLAEKGLDKIHITVNKNTIVGDKNALKPGGIRIGTPAITTRGMKEGDMRIIGEFLYRFSLIAEKNKENSTIKAFLNSIKDDKDYNRLSIDIQEFSKQFSVPGVDNYEF